MSELWWLKELGAGGRTFSTIGEFDVRRSLHGSKGAEELAAIGTDAQCKSDSKTQAYH